MAHEIHFIGSCHGRVRIHIDILIISLSVIQFIESHETWMQYRIKSRRHRLPFVHSLTGCNLEATAVVLLGNVAGRKVDFSEMAKLFFRNCVASSECGFHTCSWH